jgi:uncharacterized repeat protein (TIGR03803 family)
MDGSAPNGDLVWDGQSDLYGTTSGGGGSGCQEGLGCGTVFKVDKDGQETALHSFGGTEDGAVPVAGLVRDVAGNFYGTTEQGGGKGKCFLSCGTVFKLDASGRETVLYRFSGGKDGGYPEGRLIRGNPRRVGVVDRLEKTLKFSSARSSSMRWLSMMPPYREAAPLWVIKFQKNELFLPYRLSSWFKNYIATDAKLTKLAAHHWTLATRSDA